MLGKIYQSLSQQVLKIVCLHQDHIQEVVIDDTSRISQSKKKHAKSTSCLCTYNVESFVESSWRYVMLPFQKGR